MGVGKNINRSRISLKKFIDAKYSAGIPEQRGKKGITGFVTGIKELDAAFSKLPLQIQKKVLRPALKESAKMVAQKAKQNIPIDTTLSKKSIKVTSLKRSRVKLGMKIGAGSDSATSGLPYYIKWVEFGTKQRFTKSGANRGKVRPETRGGVLGFGGKKGFLRISLHETRKPAWDLFKELFLVMMSAIKPVT